MTHLFLFLHLLGAFCFFAGGAVVGVLQLAAIRQEKPSQVHAFLRLAPYGAAVVGVGALLTLGFGIGLAEHEGLGFSPGWIQVSIGLWVAAMVLGGYGGRTARNARHLAKKLAAEGDEPSPELRAMVAARGPLWASYASFLLLLVIVVLMVWQPVRSKAAPPAVSFPKALRQQILRATPNLAYLPTRLPPGVEYSREFSDPRAVRLIFRGSDGRDEIKFTVATAHCHLPPSTSQTRTLTVDGHQLGWDRSSDGLEHVWRCVPVNEVVSLVLAADPLRSGVDLADLETVVIYAEPIG